MLKLSDFAHENFFWPFSSIEVENKCKPWKSDISGFDSMCCWGKNWAKIEENPHEGSRSHDSWSLIRRRDRNGWGWYRRLDVDQHLESCFSKEYRISIQIWTSSTSRSTHTTDSQFDPDHWQNTDPLRSGSSSRGPKMHFSIPDTQEASEGGNTFTVSI